MTMRREWSPPKSLFMVKNCIADAKLKTHPMAAVAQMTGFNRKGLISDVDSADI
jgi:hypothetical protein